NSLIWDIRSLRGRALWFRRFCGRPAVPPGPRGSLVWAPLGSGMVRTPPRMKVCAGQGQYGAGAPVNQRRKLAALGEAEVAAALQRAGIGGNGHQDGKLLQRLRKEPEGPDGCALGVAGIGGHPDADFGAVEEWLGPADAHGRVAVGPDGAAGHAGGISGVIEG